MVRTNPDGRPDTCTNTQTLQSRCSHYVSHTTIGLDKIPEAYFPLWLSVSLDLKNIFSLVTKIDRSGVNPV